jgi:hypothetical protein
MKAYIGIFLLFFSNMALACEPVTFGELYWPNPTKDDIDLDVVGSVSVNLVSVSRGGSSAPCGDAGIVKFRVNLADELEYGHGGDASEIEEEKKEIFSNVGFYFIAKSKDQYGILAGVPFKAEKSPDDGQYYISFAWVDNQPGQQKDINLSYEVRLITNSLELGDIKSGVIKAKRVNK